MERHASVLYILAVFLLIFQIISFVFMSLQFSKLDARIDDEINKVRENLTAYFDDALKKTNTENQRLFNDLSLAVAHQASQQKSFEKEIDLLQTAKGDFSAVIEDVVKGVVAVITENSMGSGFIVKTDGYVVTNYHVIQQGENIRVLTYEKEPLPATVLGVDRLRDLALLKIEGAYNALELADSDELQVGRKVIAIGNPLGLSFTVTEGIISGLEREGPNGLAEYVQTDVSLNPGNSGGPLINTEGEVVGINNFKIGGAENLGFALESNVIKSSLNTILNESVIE